MRVSFAQTISVLLSMHAYQIGAKYFQFWDSTHWPRSVYVKSKYSKTLFLQVTRAHGNARAVRKQFREILPGEAQVKSLSRPSDHLRPPNSGFWAFCIQGKMPWRISPYKATPLGYKCSPALPQSSDQAMSDLINNFAAPWGKDFT